MRYERQCSICGTSYEYCPNCARFNHLPRWMFSFHDENCMNIWSVINDYKAGVKTANEAKAELEKLDLSKKDSFVPAFKTTINKIMAEGGQRFEDKTEKIGMKKYNNSERKFTGNK